MSVERLKRYGVAMLPVEEGRRYPEGFTRLREKLTHLQQLYNEAQAEFEHVNGNAMWSPEGKAKKLAEIAGKHWERLAKLEHQASAVDDAIVQAERDIDKALKVEMDPTELAFLRQALLSKSESERLEILMRATQESDGKTLRAFFDAPSWVGLARPEVLNRMRTEAGAAVAPGAVQDLEDLRGARSHWQQAFGEVKAAVAEMAPELELQEV